MTSTNNNWHELLKDPAKYIYGGLVWFKKDKYWSAFDYTNDSPYREQIDMVLLGTDGQMPVGSKIETLTIDGRKSVHIDTRDFFKGLGFDSFVGSLMLVIKFIELDKSGKVPSVIRTLMSSWHSPDYHAQVGTGFQSNFNEDHQRNKLSFFMFSPSHMVTDNFKTISVIYNYSTQADYNDTVILTPRVNSGNGDHFFAEDISIPPFGTGIFDLEKCFNNGKVKKDSRYVVSMAHQRYTFASFFFNISRKNGAIINGRHTQPPASVLRPKGVNLPANIFRQYVPFVSDPAVNLAKRILGKELGESKYDD